MRRVATFILLTLWLGGCGSFNTINKYIIVEGRQVPERQVPATKRNTEVEPHRHKAASGPTSVVPKSKPPRKATPIKKTTSSVGRVVCPEIVFQQLPPTPTVPTEELRKISPLDRASVNKLTIRHIEELRQHITLIKSQIAATEKRLQQDCHRIQAAGPK